APSGSHPSPRSRAAAPRHVARRTHPRSSTRRRRRRPPRNRAGLLCLHLHCHRRQAHRRPVPPPPPPATATGRSRLTTRRSQWSASYSCSTTNPIQSVINHSSAN
uniref:Uncharacterized protein n=1 Tax=Oryza brachyantha TaxID=4533 RepID=J3M8N5_ORYBR